MNLIRKNECNLCQESAVGHEDIAGSFHIVTLEEGTEVRERRVKLRLQDGTNEWCGLLDMEMVCVHVCLF